MAATAETFCCDEQCMEIPSDQIDGRACELCCNFGYCLCHCRSLKLRFYTIRYVPPEQPSMVEMHRELGFRDKGRRYLYDNTEPMRVLLRFLREVVGDVAVKNGKLHVMFGGCVNAVEREFFNKWQGYIENAFACKQ